MITKLRSACAVSVIGWLFSLIIQIFYALLQVVIFAVSEFTTQTMNFPSIKTMRIVVCSEFIEISKYGFWDLENTKLDKNLGRFVGKQIHRRAAELWLNLADFKLEI